LSILVWFLFIDLILNYSGLIRFWLFPIRRWSGDNLPTTDWKDNLWGNRDVMRTSFLEKTAMHLLNMSFEGVPWLQSFSAGTIW
jgi:hypothetical protein